MYVKSENLNFNMWYNDIWFEQLTGLDYLAVHPEYQGHGVGTALVQSGMKHAEKIGLDIFIHALEAGVGVYKRLGFHIEKDFVQDDSIWGGEGEHHVYLMTYE